MSGVPAEHVEGYAVSNSLNPSVSPPTCLLHCVCLGCLLAVPFGRAPSFCHCSSRTAGCHRPQCSACRPCVSDSAIHLGRFDNRAELQRCT
jgi:hypothetical protein